MTGQASGDDLLVGLNEQQKQAVRQTEGPVLIFAGAGSGKTRVLTHRIAYIIATGRAYPRQVLAVTFTNKAAGELTERIGRLVGPEGSSIMTGTFHKVCARLLREFGEQVGIPRDFVVCDDGDQRSMIREALGRLNYDEKRFPVNTMLSMISRAKERLVTSHDYGSHFRGFVEDRAREVYRLYQERLEESHLMDYDDLLMKAVVLLETAPDALARVQQRYRYVLVDEYQDVNFAQYRLLALITAKSRNLCVVGDDDQSIYAFRGADVELMHRFDRDHPDACVIKLERNYRSTQVILSAAHAVVSRNPGRVTKELWTDKEGGCPVTVHEAANEIEEAVFVVQKVQEQVRLGRRKMSDFAVLYRTNAQSRAFEEVFMNWALRYRMVGSVRFYQRKEIKDVLAYLRLLHNPLDAVSLQRVINVPARAIGATTIGALTREAEASGRPLWEVVCEAHLLTSITPRARAAISGFATMINGLREEREQSTLTALTRAVLERSGYLREMETDHTREGIARTENVRELLTVTHQFDETVEDASLALFLEQVALVSDLDSLDGDADAVTLMTLHMAKGLEFPVVFLVGMEEGLFPYSRSLNSEKDISEERRLCYVGMTRAREELYLSHAYRRELYGQTTANPSSRFLREANLVVAPQPRSDVTARTGQPKAWGAGPSAPATAKPSCGKFKAGQRVKHQVFGVGVVLGCAPSGDDVQVTVAFPNSGVRKLLESLAGLEPA